MQAPLLFEGSADHLAIEAYVEQVLAPTLREGQIVLFDNASAHKRARLEPLLAQKQCKLWFLPAYSPDLTPIELAFAKTKQAVRRAAARTKKALQVAIAEALASITSADARGFFDHCGYLVSSPMLNWFAKRYRTPSDHIKRSTIGGQRNSISHNRDSR